MLDRLRFALCVAVLFVLQAAVAPRFTFPPYGGPDLLLLASAFLALEADWPGALWGAFALGLLRGLGSVEPLGLGPLVLVPAAAALHALREHLVRESPLTDLVLTFAFVLSGGCAFALATALLSRGDAGALAAGALGTAAFTTALAPFLFPVLTGARLVRPRPA